MQIIQDIQKVVAQAIQSLYGAEVEPSGVTVNVTSREFSGNYTVVLFPFVRIARKAPDVMGEEIGIYDHFLKNTVIHKSNYLENYGIPNK